MTDDTLSPQDEQLLAFLARGVPHLWLVRGIEDGFDEEQARTVLASSSLMEALADIGGGVEAGSGFVRAALEQTERGALNRRLLRQASRSRRSPDGTHTVGRYELAAWLKEYHPGTGDPSAPLDEVLLDIELGALAWQNAGWLGGTTLAAAALEGKGTAILELARRVEGWTGWRRELADEVVVAACRAFLATHPGAQESPVISRVLARIDADEPYTDVVEEALGEATAVRPSTRRGFALAAGAEGDGVVVRSGNVVIDPGLVAPRSVAPGWEGLWDVLEGDEVWLRIRVAAGDAPVAALTAHVTVDGDRHVVALPRDGAAYDGTLVLEDVPVSVRVEATAVGAEPTRVPDEEIADLREAIVRAIRGRRDRVGTYDDGSVNPVPLANRPFLCEIVAWDPLL